MGKPINLQFDDSMDVVEGLCENISIGGMFIQVENTRSQGSLVRFELQIDHSTAIRGLGEVVWMRPKPGGPDRPPGIGIKFRFLEQRDRQLIFKLVSQHIKDRLAKGQPAGARSARARAAAAPKAPSDRPRPPSAAPKAPSGPPRPPSAAPKAPSGPPRPPSAAPPPSAGKPAAPAATPKPSPAAGLEEPARREIAALFDVVSKEQADEKAPAAADEAPAADERSDQAPEPVAAAESPPAEPLPVDLPALEVPSEEAPALGIPPAEEAAPPAGAVGASPPDSLSAEPPPAEVPPSADAALADIDAELQRLEEAPALAAKTGSDLPDAGRRDAELLADLNSRPGAEASPSEEASPEPPPSAGPSPPAAAAAAPELARFKPHPPSRRKPILLALLVLVVVAAGGYSFRHELFGGSPAPPTPAGERAELAAGEAAGGAPEPAPPPAAPPDAADYGAAPSAGTPQDGSPAGRTPEPGDTDASAEPELALPAESPPPPKPPLPAEPPAPVASGDAFTRVVDISWSSAPGGLLVAIEGDGPIPQGRYRHFRLEQPPPREVIKLLGVREGFPSPALEVGGPAVQQIRTGHHKRASGDELHIVLDLLGPQARIAEIRVEGSRLEVLVEAP